MDLIEACYDEIALEGLDGITLNSLWYRLSKRQPAVSIAVDENSKAYYWMLVVSLHEVEFFCLPLERADVTDIEAVFDPEARLLVYKEHPFIKMYPFNPVSANGIQGSCSTIDTRVNVTPEIRSSDYTPLLSFAEVVQRWGRKLVIVASQRRRELALIGTSKDSATVIPLLDGINYFYLEAIGRSRSEGLLGTDAGEHLQVSGKKLTQGKLFYHKKVLTSLGLVYKQDYMVLKAGRHSSDNVCHLVRFFKPLKTFYMDLHDKLEQHLLKLPNHRDVKRNAFQAVDPDGKWTRFKRFAQERVEYFVSEHLPYSELYPENSSNAEQGSTPNRRKTVACLRLLKRRVDKAGDVEEGCELSDEEEDETPGDQVTNDEAVPKVRLRCGESVLQQIAEYIQSQGPSGASQWMIRRHFNLHTLVARNIVKAIVARKLFAAIHVDKGRQREQRFRTDPCHETPPRANARTETVSLPAVTESAPTAPASATALVHSGTSTAGRRRGRARTIPTQRPSAKGAERGVTADSGPSSVTVSAPDANAPTAKTRTRRCRRASAAADAVSSDTTASSSTDGSSATTKNKPATADPKSAGHTEDSSAAFALPTHDAKGNETARVAGKVEVTTTKMQERMDFIVKRVLHDRVMTFAAVAKELKESEASKYKDTLDRKSLGRLIDRLARDGKIKSYKTLIQVEGKKKEHHYICEPGMSLDDRLLLSVIEQERCSLLTSKLAADQRLESKKKEEGAADAVDGQGDTILRNPLDASTGRIYGYQPRFRRMEILHTFLWYLTYGYEGCNSPVSFDDNRAVYVNEVSWKRCVPPLPNYPGLDQGWCLLADAIAFMPVSMFLHMIRIPYKIDGMRELLADPLKAAMLVRDLPDDMRCVLMYKRHYATWMYQMAQLLSLARLLTFGKTTASFKDTIFIYIHRNVSVKDTTSVQPGYAICKSSEPLPVRTYQLKDDNTVKEFWEDLRDVCLNTPLGQKRRKDEAIVVGCWPVLTKPSLQHIFKPRAPADVVDDGSPGGDGLGAGGLDSCFFSHRLSNWVSNQHGKKSSKQPPSGHVTLPLGMLPSYTMPAISLRAGRLPGLGDGGDKWLRLSTVAAHEQSLAAAIREDPLIASTSDKATPGGGAGRKRTQGLEGGGGPTKKPKLFLRDDAAGQNRAKKRKLSPEMSPAEKRAKKNPFDDVDMQAFGNMQTLRAVWRPHEDLMLLLCAVGMRALNVPSSLMLLRHVRDWLHEHCETTCDKSATACQRRLTYLRRKSKEARQSVNVFLAYALKNEEVLKFRQGKVKVRSDELAVAFKGLMEVLLKLMHEPAQHRQAISLPGSLEKLLEIYEIENPYSPDYVVPGDVTTGDDAQADVLKQIIVGYLLLDDKFARTKEMRQMLSYYPDNVLERIVFLMRCNGLLVKPKISPRRMHVPQIRHYDLSNVYQNTFLLTSRFNKDHYKRTWADYCQLIRCESDEHSNAIAAPYPSSDTVTVADVASTSQARCLVLATLVAKNKVLLDCKLPENVATDQCHSPVISDVPISHVVPRHLCRAGSATQYLVLKRVQHAIEQSPQDSLPELAAVQQLYPLATVRNLLDLSAEEGKQPETNLLGNSSLRTSRFDSLRQAYEAAAVAARRSSTASAGDAAKSDKRVSLGASVASGSDRLADLGSIAAARDGAVCMPSASCSESSDDDDVGGGGGGDDDDEDYRPPGRVRLQQQQQPPMAERPPATESNRQPADDRPRLHAQLAVTVKAGCPFVLDEVPGHCSSKVRSLTTTGRDILQTLAKVVPLPIPDYSSRREQLANSGFPHESLAAVDELHAFVHAQGELGAKLTALEEQFPRVSNLFMIVGAMVKCNMILRVGTVAFHYVSMDNCDKWMAKSLSESCCQNDAGDDSHRNTDPDSGDFTDNLRERTYELVAFVPRIWRKVDGLLNAEVFSNVLSGVMTFAMMIPACSMTRLYEKFRKILSPVSVLEAIEVLEQLGCVRLEETRPLTKPSLFSKPSGILRKTTCAAAAVGLTCVIPAVDCMLRLGQFLEQLDDCAAH